VAQRCSGRDTAGRRVAEKISSTYFSSVRNSALPTGILCHGLNPNGRLEPRGAPRAVKFHASGTSWPCVSWTSEQALRVIAAWSNSLGHVTSVLPTAPRPGGGQLPYSNRISGMRIAVVYTDRRWQRSRDTVLSRSAHEVRKGASLGAYATCT